MEEEDVGGERTRKGGKRVDGERRGRGVETEEGKK